MTNEDLRIFSDYEVLRIFSDFKVYKDNIKLDRKKKFDQPKLSASTK